MIELASIVVLGIFAQWLAWRFKVPAILPLILTGLAVGPFAPYWMPHDWLHGGDKWLNPIFDEAAHVGLFPGDHLFHFVELAIGIILFEGGLTLKRHEIKSIGNIIGKLISLGSAVTFFTAAPAAHYIIGLSWPLSFLFSGLIIVTGPTVIAPILRNIPLKKNVANILKWEGILIDPIGALVAVLVYEFLASLAGDHSGGHGDSSFTAGALKHFITLTLVGLSLGTLAAYAFREIVKRHWVPHYLLTVFTLAVVLVVFVGSGVIVADSGLLTIVVMGTVLANIDLPNMDEIMYFKESIAVLLISMLFILLAANVTIEDLKLLLSWQAAVLFLVIILIVRPLGVFLSALNSPLSQNEKLFISWVGPRGIVAAGIASLFGSKLMALNAKAIAENKSIPFEGAEMITPLVFMIVLGTVLLNATTAGIVAKWLKVVVDKSNGILIIGAHKATRLIASYLQENGRNVVLIDSNKNNVEKAATQGLTAFQTNIYSDDMSDNIELNDMGYLMAMTGSAEVNKYAFGKFKSSFGENGSFRFISSEERKNTDVNPNEGLFSAHDDYISFIEVARDYPHIYEVEVNEQEAFKELLAKINQHESRIPIFIKDSENDLQIIPSNSDSITISEGYKLVYLGKELLQEIS